MTVIYLKLVVLPTPKPIRKWWKKLSARSLVDREVILEVNSGRSLKLVTTPPAECSQEHDK